MVETKIKDEKHISTDVINGLIVSIQDILPHSTEVGLPSLIEAGTFGESEKGVLMGLSGDLNGQIILEGCSSYFNKLAQDLFGFTVDDDMLDSFVCNLGKMLVGNMIANLSFKGIHLNYYSPTIIGGQPIYTTLNRAIHLPIRVHLYENININILFNNE